MRSAWIQLALLGAASLACQPELREGHYACTSDLDCPADWHCRADRRCWSTATDVRPDTGVPDAEAWDRGLPQDAEPSDLSNLDRGTLDAGDAETLRDADPRPDADPIDVGPDSGCASNAGTPCNRQGYCDAVFACDGTCSGGTPLPTCQCGTPTCGGCAGGTCGDNSVCQNGTCVCAGGNSACSCDGMVGVECRYCALDGDLHVCSTDSYACGVLVRGFLTCPGFGCDPVDDLCYCAPDEGDPCDLIDACDCGIEFCPLPGFVDCDGSCVPDTDCSAVCFQGLCTL